MKLPTAESKRRTQEQNQEIRTGSSHSSAPKKNVRSSEKSQIAQPLQRFLHRLADFSLPKPLLLSGQDSGSKSGPKNGSKSAQKSSQDALKGQATTPKASQGQEAAASGSPSVVSETSTSNAANAPTAKGASKPAWNGGRLPFIKDSKGNRLAFNLLLVRPWVLMLGFWVFSLLGAGVAVEGMISPRKLKMDLPETAEVTPTESETAFVKVEPSAEDEPASVAAEKAKSIKISPAGGSSAETAEAGSAETAIDGTQASTNTSGFPAGPLVALVGTCAAGCFVISRRRAMVRMAAARTRSRARRARPKVESVVIKGAQKSPQVRMASSGLPIPSTVSSPSAGLRGKKRRQRNKRVAAVGQPRPGSRKLVSRSTAQQASGGLGRQGAPKTGPKSAKRTADSAKPSSRTLQSKRSSSRMRNRRQGVVSVVPASESHALDWSNGSLAHELDVRPQRTASM